MSRKGCLNKKPSIAYPRKCEYCDYVSNNPTMYHYHKKTHESIPDGQLCEHGCNQQAKYRNTGGVYSCSKISQHCPEYLRVHAERISDQWKNAVERKASVKTSQMNTADALEKRKNWLKEKWGDFTPEQMKDFRHYSRRVRVRAQRWAKEQGYVLGQQTYHVDHKFSVWDAWRANLPESVVNHPANLQILEAKKNSSKGAKSSLTLDELMKLINR